ncbi:MAG: polyhydroxyalkanoate depolymerase, partial [Verrucomicrobiota bacterium]
KITLGDDALKFDFKVFGQKPKDGRSLFISLHGGGGAPARINDRQWENQKGLYKPKEGIYLAPRAPTNKWDLWHRPHIDDLFDRLIENLVVLEDVNPDRVYVMGYSAGGDGVYQIGPRMADRWAAAAMMAGHPNDAKPLSLRNIGFTLHMGGKDKAYKRNQVAAEWKVRLAELQKEDPGGYAHEVVIHEDKGHWMEREDAVAVPWMAKFRRQPHPKSIVWQQDDRTHERFYWIEVSGEDQKKRSIIRATCKGQVIDLQSDDVQACTLLLSDALLNLDQPLVVRWNGKERFRGKVKRTWGNLARSLEKRGDPRLMAPVRLDVTHS